MALAILLYRTSSVTSAKAQQSTVQMGTIEKDICIFLAWRTHFYSILQLKMLYTCDDRKDCLRYPIILQTGSFSK